MKKINYNGQDGYFMSEKEKEQFLKLLDNLTEIAKQQEVLH